MLQCPLEWNARQCHPKSLYIVNLLTPSDFFLAQCEFDWQGTEHCKVYAVFDEEAVRFLCFLWNTGTDCWLLRSTHAPCLSFKQTRTFVVLSLISCVTSALLRLLYLFMLNLSPNSRIFVCILFLRFIPLLLSTNKSPFFSITEKGQLSWKAFTRGRSW